MNSQVSGKNRRTLAMIDRYPTPEELYERIMSNSWPYAEAHDWPSYLRRETYIARDRALAALLYLVALRRSEARRLIKTQFKQDDKPFRLESIKLSKAEKHDRKTGKTITRKDLFRKEARIPLHGERGKLGQLVLTYLDMLGDKDRLFPFSEKSSRITQIIKHVLGVPPHWERAYGENYLYDLWDKDVLAVASYVQVDPRTLTKYIHGTHTKYLDRET